MNLHAIPRPRAEDRLFMDRVTELVNRRLDAEFIRNATRQLGENGARAEYDYFRRLIDEGAGVTYAGRPRPVEREQAPLLEELRRAAIYLRRNRYDREPRVALVVTNRELWQLSQEDDYIVENMGRRDQTFMGIRLVRDG